jgi:hypothetical protein
MLDIGKVNGKVGPGGRWDGSCCPNSRGVESQLPRNLVIDLGTKLQSHKFVFAFPSVDNHQSNAICKKLGFALTEQVNSEYPPGSKRFLDVNIWVLSLPGGGTDASVSS